MHFIGRQCKEKEEEEKKRPKEKFCSKSFKFEQEGDFMCSVGFIYTLQNRGNGKMKKLKESKQERETTNRAACATNRVNNSVGNTC